MKNNILFFMVDQLSQKWIETAFAGVCEIPNIKRLIESGTYFKNFITCNPVCSPSRATIATGLSARGHGVLQNGYNLDPKLPNFMKILKNDGYQSGVFGKVHFRSHFGGFWPDYKVYGFDETHITEDGRGGEWLDWIEANHPEYYEKVLQTIWATEIPEFESYGLDGRNLKKRLLELKQNAVWATDEYPENTLWASTLPFPTKLSQTEWITMHAVDYLKRIDHKSPFFAQISYVQPHNPFHPPEEYMKEVNTDLIPLPIEAEWMNDPNAPKYFTDYEYEKPISNDMYARHCYFADLIHLDHQLGKIINTLKETNQYHNTYILMMSDHGELLGDHGFYGKGERHYDACIRSPLVIAGPGLKKGNISNELVQHNDIFPTILEMSETRAPIMPKMGDYLKIDAKDIPVCSGESLISICKGHHEQNWRKEAYIESYNPICSIALGDWARSIRTKNFRYTYYPNGKGEQLFDLINDPDEQDNIINEQKYQDIKRELKDRLLECIIRQDYPKTRRELFALGVH